MQIITYFDRRIHNERYRMSNSLHIEMVDLKGQYLRIKEEIDSAVLDCLQNGQFIQGKSVSNFEEKLSQFTQSPHVISCGNGTDALQLACMALGLKAGDKVILPAFTYIATAEVLLLLGITPVYADVDENTFNISAESIEKVLEKDVKAIMVVHLFGQCADMEPILQLAQKHDLKIIEDNAQSIGSEYQFSNGVVKQAGTIGEIGTTSFFPSKNLGAFGDGGALFTANESLALHLRKLANHGQSQRYYHEMVGINSRLDTLQAAILEVKLKYLNNYIAARQTAANYFDNLLKDIDGITLPYRQKNSSHVFHQYTLKIKNGVRDSLAEYLKEAGIPYGIYYPLPVFEQEAYSDTHCAKKNYPVSIQLCKEVISLPMHTELSFEMQEFIAEKIITFIKNHHD